MGVHFDYLLRMNKHHAIQLSKAKKAVKANAKIFYNRNIEAIAKIICYQLLVKPIIAYAAPVLWNMGPTIMEKYRKFERACLRACLGKYRSPESECTKIIDSQTIYNLANIPRFDSFCLILTRNYYSSLYEIDNDILKNLKVRNETEVLRMAKSNYTPLELFTNLDRLGCIQDQRNVPILYHIQRHCVKKAIIVDIENVNNSRCVFSQTLPTRDRKSLDRLTEKY